MRLVSSAVHTEEDMELGRFFLRLKHAQEEACEDKLIFLCNDEYNKKSASAIDTNSCPRTFP